MVAIIGKTAYFGGSAYPSHPRLTRQRSKCDDFPPCFFILLAASLFRPRTEARRRSRRQRGPRLDRRRSGCPEAARSRRRPVRRRRIHQGRRGLAVGDRALSAQQGPLRRPHAAGQLLARHANGPTTGPASTSKPPPAKRTRRRAAGRSHAEDGHLLLSRPQLRQVLSGDARRDREVPGQPASQPGVLLHRPGPLPARPLQPGDSRLGKGRHDARRRERPGRKGRSRQAAVRARSKTPTWPCSSRIRAIKVACKTASGDEEDDRVLPGRPQRAAGARLVPSRLGKPSPKQRRAGSSRRRQGQGHLHRRAHRGQEAEGRRAQGSHQSSATRIVAITDGAFSETVNGVVLGKNGQRADHRRRSAT